MSVPPESRADESFRNRPEPAPSDLTRRTLLGRAAAAGLLATPAAGLLSACVGGGGGDEEQDQATGTKSAENPLGVDPKALPGDRHLQRRLRREVRHRRPRAAVQEEVPGSEDQALRHPGDLDHPAAPVRRRQPARLREQLRHQVMDFGALVGDGQLQDLTELFDAPSVDDPNKKVRDTLVAGTVESGTYNGKPYVLNYVFTVFGLWYSDKLFSSRGWTPPTTWSEFTSLLDNIKKAGIIPYGYAGKNAPYYQYLVILTTAAKIGGAGCAEEHRQPGRRRVDRGPGQAGGRDVGGDRRQVHGQVPRGPDPHRGAAAAEPGQGGHLPQWLLAGERAGEVHPAGFNYAVMPVPSATASDKLPAKGLYATAGEPYFVSAKGRNPRGAMEYMRLMLSQEGAKGFVNLNKSLTAVTGAAEGVELSPGLTSASSALTAAGQDVFSYRFDSWYKKLDDELRTATNELMFGRENADQFVAPDAEEGRRHREGLVDHEVLPRLSGLDAEPCGTASIRSSSASWSPRSRSTSSSSSAPYAQAFYWR